MLEKASDEDSEPERTSSRVFKFNERSTPIIYAAAADQQYESGSGMTMTTRRSFKLIPSNSQSRIAQALNSDSSSLTRIVHNIQIKHTHNTNFNSNAANNNSNYTTTSMNDDASNDHNDQTGSKIKFKKNNDHGHHHHGGDNDSNRTTQNITSDEIDSDENDLEPKRK
jgi:hypothetical protein